MAKKEKNSPKENISALRAVGDIISSSSRGSTNRIYRGMNKSMEDFNKLTGDITRNVDKQSSTVKFLSDIATTKSSTPEDKEFIKTLNSLYKGGTDVPIMSQLYRESLLRNRLYDDYDLIMKFMPQLKGIIRDTVVPAILSPNDHTKSFLSLKVSQVEDEDKKWEKSLNLMQKTELLPIKIKELIEQTCYYGVQRCRVVSYSTLLTRLNRSISSKSGRLNEAYNSIELKVDTDDSNIKSIYESFESYKLNLPENMNKTDFLNGVSKSLVERVNRVVIDNADYKEGVDELAYRSMAMNYENIPTEYRSMVEGYANTSDLTGKTVTSKNDKKIKSDAEIADGLFAQQQVNADDKDRIDVKGVYYKREDIRKLIPCHINDIIVGYYKIDVKTMNDTMKASDKTTNLASNPYNSMTMKDLDNILADNRESYRDNYTMNFAKLLIKRTNKKFLEDNGEFAKDMYEILKYYDIHDESNNINLTFIPANEMYEIKINNGISLFDDALFPAKLYIALLISNMMLKLLRSADKRVYYIKQGIDTNVSNSLMQAIMQIKKSEISLGDMGNINRIFGYLGRFNDYFVPISPDGEKPFDFDIMQGQDVQVTQDDFMEELKKSAILALGTPYGVTDYDERTDLATRLVSENIKFSYQIIYKQMELTPYLSRMLTAYTKAMYPSLEDTVDVLLPPPVNLKLNLLSDQLNSLQSLSDMISEACLPDNSDSETFDITKRLLSKEVIKQLSSGILEWNLYDDLSEKCRVKAKLIIEKNKALTPDA